MPGSLKAGTRRRLSLRVTAGYSHATALLRGTPNSSATQAPVAEAKEKLVNDRPSSGQYPNHGYDGLSTTTFAGDSAYTSQESQGQGYNYAAYGSYETSSYDTGSYDTGGYDTTAWTTPQSSYPQQPQAGYDTADGYDGYLSTVPAQAVSTDYQSTAFGYDASAEQTGHWSVPGYAAETGTYDATAWNTGAQQQEQEQQQDYSYGYEQPQEQAQAQQYAYEYEYETYSAYEEPASASYTETSVFGVIADEVTGEFAFDPELELELDDEGDAAEFRVHDLPTQAMPVTLAAPAAPRPSRRAGEIRQRGQVGQRRQVRQRKSGRRWQHPPPHPREAFRPADRGRALRLRDGRRGCRRRLRGRTDRSGEAFRGDDHDGRARPGVHQAGRGEQQAGHAAHRAERRQPAISRTVRAAPRSASTCACARTRKRRRRRRRRRPRKRRAPSSFSPSSSTASARASARPASTGCPCTRASTSRFPTGLRSWPPPTAPCAASGTAPTATW